LVASRAIGVPTASPHVPATTITDCDIQFSRKEFLTVLDQPEHLFAKQIEQLVHAVETI